VLPRQGGVMRTVSSGPRKIRLGDSSLIPKVVSKFWFSVDPSLG
jgi:hypothetical protein